METNLLLIQPVIALVLWTFVMWLWMYATRIPAITAARMKLDPNSPSGEQMSQLPANVRWKADNYNHLMEQPTIFYAIVISLAVLGDTSTLSLYSAWAYVAFRVAHSLVQATVNIIILRFVLFSLSNIPLAILAFSAALTAFG